MSKTSKFVTREALQALREERSFLKVEYLDIPEWDGMTVGIRQLSVAEKMHKIPRDEQNQDINSVIGILTLCLVDAAGAQLFEEGDTEILLEQSDDLITRLISKALEVNGMSSSALEDLKKKAEEGQSVSSSSN